MSEFRIYSAILFLAVSATLLGSGSCTRLGINLGGGIGRQISKALLSHEFIVSHNAVRISMGMKPLLWDRKLAKYARRWANQRTDDCALKHNPQSPYGENMFWSLKPHWTPAAVVKEWVDEKPYYDRSTNQCTNGRICGHYTQVIWHDTKKVGCARVECNAGKGFLYVCSYDPPGNIYHEGPFGGQFSKSIVSPP
ncbi:hypothetical protein JCGZ_16429 [Jatropha curcas]|uniref:SCP domain-containing protein n=1 Tax=Jatropha curcas TaxID=180498 RepID=A0A067K9R7_JATCU|nr:pathogenesis-related protein PR-1 [Jatropha curcas]KDP29040.1 hypothetical protein JCGZ_16429 [Jatropha curcas]